MSEDEQSIDIGITLTCFPEVVEIIGTDSDGERTKPTILTSHVQVDELIRFLEYARKSAFPDAPGRISGFVIGDGT